MRYLTTVKSLNFDFTLEVHGTLRDGQPQIEAALLLGGSGLPVYGPDGRNLDLLKVLRGFSFSAFHALQEELGRDTQDSFQEGPHG